MATVVGGKYELLEVLRDAGIRTWRARQLKLGHILMVHFIPGSERGGDFALLDRLAQLPESARKLFFDAGEHDAVLYVVSWPLPEFDSLPDWLDRTLEKNRSQPVRSVAPTKTKSPDSSEFTRLFFKGIEEPGAPQLQESAASHIKEPPAPKNAKEPPAATQEPGEFTRLFQAPAKPQVPARPVVDPLPPPVSKETAPAPFRTGPGEFTKFFQRGDLAEPHQAKQREAEIIPTPPLFPPAERFAGRSFDVADVAPAAPPAPLPTPPKPSPTPVQPPAVNLPPVPRPPAAAASSEPIVDDDYAKVIARAPVAPPPPPAPVAPRKPAVALPALPQVQRPPQSAYLPMWITLGVLFALAIALTLILALTR
jgi:hypothetical protein